MKGEEQFVYIDTSVLLENTPLVKFIPDYIRDPSGVFSVSSYIGLKTIFTLSRSVLPLENKIAIFVSTPCLICMQVQLILSFSSK